MYAYIIFFDKGRDKLRGATENEWKRPTVLLHYLESFPPYKYVLLNICQYALALWLFDTPRASETCPAWMSAWDQQVISDRPFIALCALCSDHIWLLQFSSYTMTCLHVFASVPWSKVLTWTSALSTHSSSSESSFPFSMELLPMELCASSSVIPIAFS